MPPSGRPPRSVALRHEAVGEKENINHSAYKHTLICHNVFLEIALGKFVLTLRALEGNFEIILYIYAGVWVWVCMWVCGCGCMWVDVCVGGCVSVCIALTNRAVCQSTSNISDPRSSTRTVGIESIDYSCIVCCYVDGGGI